MKSFLILLFFVSLSLTAFGDDFIIDDQNSSSSVSSSAANSSPVSKNSFIPSGKTINSIGSVPAPAGLEKGSVYGQFTMYDSGGINSRLIIGILDAVNIGISENLDSLIGSGTVNVNIPGAYVKLTLIKDLNNFNWAMGFDSFAYGRAGTYYPTNDNYPPSTIYGYYTAAGWNYSLFGGNDVLTAGLRIPLLPAEERAFSNTSFFIGATISAPQYFMFAFTLENIFIDFSRPAYLLPSFIFSVTPTPPFYISLIFQYDFSESKLIRILSLSYEAGF